MKNPFFCVYIPSDDSDIIFKGYDGLVLFWNLYQLNQVHGFKDNFHLIFSVKFSRDNLSAIYGGLDKQMIVLNMYSMFDGLR